MLTTLAWVWLVLIGQLWKDAYSVILHKIQVPSMVLNGTLPYAILDCQYGLNQSEVDGLVLKWSLNGRTIYQWIPPAQPQGLGELRGKINLDYDFNPNPFHRHRALYLYFPTTEMSGDYTCKVSTLQNEVSLTKKMTVYEPPKMIKFTHHRNFFRQVNLTCLVDHAFPEPQLRLFHGFKDQRIELGGLEERSARYPNGAWQKVIFVVLADHALHVENVFDCEISLPHTDFVIKKTTLYSPGHHHPSVMASAANSCASQRSDSLLGGISLAVIVCLTRRRVQSPSQWSIASTSNALVKKTSSCLDGVASN